MSILKDPKNYELLNTCNKCGFCQANCYVYREVLNEAYSTRGRLRLIKAVADGQISRTSTYEKIINSCLMCEECSKNCPSGVQGHSLIQLAREDLFKEKGIPFVKKFPIESVLANNNSRKLYFNSFRLIKNIIVNPIKSLHSIRGINVKSLPIAEQDFLTNYKSRPAKANTKLKVGFYVGCMLNHTMPQAAESVVNVLEKFGCQVIVPKEQRCCGTPAFVYGHNSLAQDLAKHNVQLFDNLDVDFVVTACASCGSMLKKMGRILGINNELNESAQKFSNKVRDITELLVDELGIDLSNELSTLSGKVTYHDPCHLVRGQNVSAQPRKILQELPGHTYIEMPGASKCCGASGMFQGFYPEEATSISNKKINNISSTNADYVVTNCPACHHRIQGSLILNKQPQKVVHIAQLLDNASVK
ncbi:MAG: heterodisulfide reductase-related iron-sulfur binding cluster [Bacillota bacterium]|nr:heterodisulfide reductase-related iron-sulfur binding cluster [Bacillota bacterium]